MPGIMPDDDPASAAYHPKERRGHRNGGRIRREVTMCNFELSPEAFRQRRLEMIALADQRRLARALKPQRVKESRERRKVRVPVGSPVRLNPAPVTR
jgi:hypothetical protein